MGLAGFACRGRRQLPWSARLFGSRLIQGKGYTASDLNNRDARRPNAHRILCGIASTVTIIHHRPLAVRSAPLLDSLMMEFKKIDPRVTITTKFGEIKLRFYPEAAPRHIENFLNLVKMEFYNGTTFHRIVPGFIIQGGDPLSKEPDRLRHGSGGSRLLAESGVERPPAQARGYLHGENTKGRLEHAGFQR